MRHARCILIILLAIIFIQRGTKPVKAAGIVGNGTAVSCTESALNTALVNGGLITFNCGSLPWTIMLTSVKTIATDTTIDGGGRITLSGGNSTGLFYVNNFQGVTFRVLNLTLANATSNQEGAAIHSHYKSTLMVSNCTFVNNQTTSLQRQFDGGGGAIFLGSEAAGTIMDSTFVNNGGANGGAIYSLNSNLSIANSTFIDNKATLTSPKSGSGGAIWSDTGSLNVTDSTFSGNNAVLQGGALATAPDTAHSISINNTLLTSNTVSAPGRQSNGGAITNVKAPSGDGAFNLSNSSLTDNLATGSGGGFWNDTNGAVTMTNVTIANNKAVSVDGNSGLGGGIYKASGTFILKNVTIASNYAGLFGGGVFGKDNMTIGNSLIANNVAHNGGQNWNIKNNCSDAMTSSGYNLQYPSRNTSDPGEKDCTAGIMIANPQLLTAANNGGSTLTMALALGSPAIGFAAANCPATDQRGAARHSPCDAGAYETASAAIRGKDTIGVYRPSIHTFLLRYSNTAGPADALIQLGDDNTYPVIGDWNGDGIDTIGIYNRKYGIFTLYNSNTSNAPIAYQFVFGNPNDVPLAGHWVDVIPNDAVGHPHDGVGVHRRSNGLIYLASAWPGFNANIYSDYVIVLGDPGWQGLAGKWNGGLLDTAGVYRPDTSRFYMTNQSCNGTLPGPNVFCNQYSDNDTYFGTYNDIAIKGDWAGLGQDGIGVFHPASGTFSLKNVFPPGSKTVSQPDLRLAFGSPGDIPFSGHWIQDSTSSAMQSGLQSILTSPQSIHNSLPQASPTPSSKDDGAFD